VTRQVLHKRVTYVAESGSNLSDDRVFKYCRRWIIRGRIMARQKSWIILHSKIFVYVWWVILTLSHETRVINRHRTLYRLRMRTECSSPWPWSHCRSWSRRRQCSSACNSFTRAAWTNGIMIYKYVGSVEIIVRKKVHSRM